MRRRGFTLFEVIIVLVVISALATISYVGYLALVNRSRSASTSATVSSYLVQAQSLWSVDRDRDWSDALTRAGRDLPDGWTITLTNDPSTGELQLVGAVDAATVGVAVENGNGNGSCFGRIVGTRSPEVWCTNAAPIAATAIAGQ